MINRTVKPDKQGKLERDPIRINFYRNDDNLEVDVIAGGEDWSLELSWDEAPEISPKKFTPELSDREIAAVTAFILNTWAYEKDNRSECAEAAQ